MSQDARHSDPAEPTFVASVRPFDNLACTDSHPLARVRYRRGREFIGWRYVRHQALAAETGRPLEHWVRIDAFADQIVTQIHTWVSRNQLPAIADFADLHNHFDANTGWSSEIDNLSADDWAAVQWQVTDRLRTN